MLMRPGDLFGAGEAAGRQMGGDGIERLVENLESIGRGGELVGVEQADGDFVVGVGGETVVVPEMLGDGGGEVAYNAVDLLLRGLVSGGGIVARKVRKILAKAVAGSEAVVG